MGNQENTIVKNETKKANNKVAQSKRNNKKVAEVIETIETKNEVVAEVVVKIEKTKTNKTQKLIATLLRVSGVSEQNLTNFLIANLAMRKEKVKVNDYLTKLILKVAAGLEIPNEDKTSASEIFLNEIAKHSNLDVQLVTKFVIADLSSRPKTNLQAYFKDVFFKVSTNKSGIVEKIATFKRF